MSMHYDAPLQPEAAASGCCCCCCCCCCQCSCCCCCPCGCCCVSLNACQARVCLLVCVRGHRSSQGPTSIVLQSGSRPVGRGDLQQARAHQHSLVCCTGTVHAVHSRCKCAATCTSRVVQRQASNIMLKRGPVACLLHSSGLGNPPTLQSAAGSSMLWDTLPRTCDLVHSSKPLAAAALLVHISPPRPVDPFRPTTTGSHHNGPLEAECAIRQVRVLPAQVQGPTDGAGGVVQ